MRRTTLILALLVFSTLFANAQLFTSYPTPNTIEEASTLAADEDENLYVVGRQDNSQPFIKKIIPSGIMQWTTVLPINASPQAVAVTCNGDIVVTGAENNGTTDRIFVTRFNNMGNILWTKNFTGDAGIAITPLPSGDIFLGGNGDDSQTSLLYRLDASGAILWLKTFDTNTRPNTYSGSASEGVSNIFISPDEDTYMIHIQGVVNPFGFPSFPHFMIYVDGNGNEIRRTSFSGSVSQKGFTLIQDVKQTVDGGFAVFNRRSVDRIGPFALLQTYDRLGAPSQSFTTYGPVVERMSLIPFSDGDIGILGNPPNTNEVVISRVDLQTESIQIETLGTYDPSNEIIMDAICLGNDRFAITGFSNIGSGKDIFVGRFSATAFKPLVCQNINATFDNGTSGWFNFGGTTFQNGQAIIGPMESGFGADRNYAVSPGDLIQLSANTKISDTELFAGFGVKYFDAAGVEIREDNHVVSSCKLTETILHSVAPDAAASVQVWAYKSGDTGLLTFEDFCLNITDGPGFDPFKEATDYCSVSSQSASPYYISNVKFSNTENPSGPSTYSDFTALPISTFGTFVLEVTAANTSFPDDEVYLGVWLDYNNDGDFEDAEEASFISSGSFNRTLEIFIRLPEEIETRRTRIRIAISRTPINGPCDGITEGEVEDYVLNLDYFRSDCLCEDVFAPVCANNEQFDNACEARCAGYGRWEDGPCDSDAKPDLFTSGFSIDSPIQQDQNATFSYLQYNTGDAEAESFSTRIFLSEDGQLDAQDLEIETFTESNFSPSPFATTRTSIFNTTGIAPGTYTIFIVTDALNEVEESNEGNNTATFFPFVIEASGGDGADLTVIIECDDINPGIYQNRTYTITVQNTGDEDATGVEIEFEIPTSSLAITGNGISTSKGTYNWPYDKWQIGTIAAGTSERLIVTWFTLSADPISLYAQVSAMNEADRDSRPGNGVCCDPIEDDEAVYTLGTGGSTGDGDDGDSCNISAVFSGVQCIDNGTPDDPVDDLYSFTFTIEGNTGDQWITSIYRSLQTGFYNREYTLGNYPVSNGPLALTFTDINDRSCFTNLRIDPPAPCSNDNGEGVDLEVDLQVNNSTPSLWQNVVYTLTISNLGDEDATDVIVDFDFGAQLPNNERPLSFVSQLVDDGNYNSWTGEWAIGDLPAGTGITLEVTLFTLASAAPNTTIEAKVLSLNETDSDLNNNTSEATITIDNSAAAPRAQTRSTLTPTNAPPRFLQLAPNPTANITTVTIEAFKEAPAQLKLFNSYGQLLTEKQIMCTPGLQFEEIDLQDLPAGIYYLSIEGDLGAGRSPRLKVVRAMF